MVVTVTPRGVRNRNPGNIRKSADDWLGLSDNQDDPSFFVFTEPVYGLRAIAKIVLKYQRKCGLDTVRKIIDRWAPPTENDTASYAEAVAHDIGISPDEHVDFVANRNRLVSLVAAIVRHENGQNPYQGTMIKRAVDMALA